MFTISFHAWRTGWIASQSSFVYLRRSSESVSHGANFISITVFLGIGWTETMVVFFYFGFSDIAGIQTRCRLHFVSYVNIARIPFSGLEADLALLCFFFFFFSILDYNFSLFLPKAGSPLHSSSSSSSRHLSSPLFKPLQAFWVGSMNIAPLSYVPSTQSEILFSQSIASKEIHKSKQILPR